MITATPFLAAAAGAKLEDWGPLEEATGDPMHTSGTTLWSGEGAQEAGVWECAPGPGRRNRAGGARHQGPLPAARRRLAERRQLKTNLRAADLRLTAEQTAALDAASQPHVIDYPYGELGQEQRARRLAGGR
jgi:hypothetical protein